MCRRTSTYGVARTPRTSEGRPYAGLAWQLLQQGRNGPVEVGYLVSGPADVRKVQVQLLPFWHCAQLLHSVLQLRLTTANIARVSHSTRATRCQGSRRCKTHPPLPSLPTSFINFSVSLSSGMGY